MVTGVVATGSQFEILGPIVGLDPVFVVDHLIGSKASAENALHDNSMLQTITGNIEVAIPAHVSRLWVRPRATWPTFNSSTQKDSSDGCVRTAKTRSNAAKAQASRIEPGSLSLVHHGGRGFRRGNHAARIRLATRLATMARLCFWLRDAHHLRRPAETFSGSPLPGPRTS